MIKAHPFLTRPANLAIYGAIWLAAALFLLFLLHFSIHLSWEEAARDAGLSCFWYAALALGFWYPVRYAAPQKQDRLNFFITHLLAAATVTAIWLGAVYVFRQQLAQPSAAWQTFWETSLPWRGMVSVLLYAAITAFYYLLIYQHRLRDNEVRQAKLSALLREAQLTSLRLQFNPHFLFNSLNSLNALIPENPHRAVEMTVRLATYLRSALRPGEQELRSLAEELEWNHHYLELEKIRFDDKMSYREQLDPQAQSALVPAMILQPLFENALKHGVYENIEATAILFHAVVSADRARLTITLRNQVPEVKSASQRTGRGLMNLSRRLQLIYGEEGRLTIQREQGWFEVRLDLPFKPLSKHIE